MIQVAETCGMCFGAREAYQNVKKLLGEKKTGRVILYKKLLHNSDVIHSLISRGAEFSEEIPADLKDKDVLVLRAHGETKDFITRLAAANINTLDCTCKKVKKIHELIEKKHNEGRDIIIIGDKNHAEVKGSAGWCGGGAFIVTEESDIHNIGDSIKQKIFVIAQTTFNETAFAALSEKLKSVFAGREIEIYNSLCDAQRGIQDSSAALAAKCKTMIILGGGESANTRELFEKCRLVCPETLRFDGKTALFQALFSSASFPFSLPLGISGGASTPRAVIEECTALLEWAVFYKNAYAKIKAALEKTNIAPEEDNAITSRVMKQFESICKSEKAKYIRGALVMLGFRAARDFYAAGEYEEDESVELAAAYELLETAILVHDDVFDSARKRRGVQTIHEAVLEWYGGLFPRRRAAALRCASQAAAICAGDIGFYFVNKKIIDSYKGHKQFAAVFSALQEIMITTIKGEMLDILAPLENQPENTDGNSLSALALDIDKMKTAAYTTAGPLALGMLLGGAEKKELAEIRRIALSLGVVFQLKDDLLDIYGGAERGKNNGTDIAEHKITLLYALACAKPAYKAALKKYYGKKITERSLKAVRDIFEKSGAKQEIEGRIQRELDTCGTALGALNLKSESTRRIIAGLIAFFELREH